MNLTQLIEIVHNIWKVRGSNPDKKKASSLAIGHWSTLLQTVNVNYGSDDNKEVIQNPLCAMSANLYHYFILLFAGYSVGPSWITQNQYIA